MRVASTVLTSSLLSSFFSVYLLKSLSRVVFQLAPLCFMGFPWGLTVKESACSCRRPGFNSWVGKIPWRRERLPTPVFLPGEFHELHSPWGHKEWDMTERLSHSICTEILIEGGFLNLFSISSVQFSHSVVSDSLRPHEPQHARPRCPSLTSRVHPNSFP